MVFCICVNILEKKVARDFIFCEVSMLVFWWVELVCSIQAEYWRAVESWWTDASMGFVDQYVDRSWRFK